MEISEKEACCLLTTLDDFGPSIIKKMKDFAGSYAACLDTPPEEFLSIHGFGEKKAAGLGCLQRSCPALRREFSSFASRGIRTIFIDDDAYPERLRLISEAPPVLYVLGRLPDDSIPSVSIIGARMCSDYGLSVAEYFAGELARNGIQVISGMAYGIDAAAARGALSCGCDSFAVLGSGVDVCYPKDNMDIYRLMSGTGTFTRNNDNRTAVSTCGLPVDPVHGETRITDAFQAWQDPPGTGSASPGWTSSHADTSTRGTAAPRGGIISEFWPGSAALARHFVMRNRIIAGLCDALIVIEARERSGTSITVSYALEQGKDVFALPGRITDPLGRGCNQLLKDGAIPLTEPGDVLSYFGIDTPDPGEPGHRSLSGLTDTEQKLYNALDPDPRHIEDLAAACGLRLSEAMKAVSSLERKNYAINTGRVYYRRAL